MKDELEQFLRRYEKAANSCDFDLVAPFIDEHAVFWFSNGSYKGIVAIRKAFEETWATIKEETYAIHNVEWLFVTELEAVCLYTFTSEGKVDGQRQRYQGRGTNILQKKDGKWKMIHEHLSKKE